MGGSSLSIKEKMTNDIKEQKTLQKKIADKMSPNVNVNPEPRLSSTN